MKKTFVKSTALVLVFAMLLSVFAVFGSVKASAEATRRRTTLLGQYIEGIYSQVKNAKEQIGNALGVVIQSNPSVTYPTFDPGKLILPINLNAKPELEKAGLVTKAVAGAVAGVKAVKVAADAEKAALKIAVVINALKQGVKVVGFDMPIFPDNSNAKPELKKAGLVTKAVVGAVAGAKAVKVAVDAAKAALKTAVIFKTVKEGIQFVYSVPDARRSLTLQRLKISTTEKAVKVAVDAAKAALKTAVAINAVKQGVKVVDNVQDVTLLRLATAKRSDTVSNIFKTVATTAQVVDAMRPTWW